MVSPLETAIQSLQEFGFFSVMLPFLLVFSILYGILERTKLFGENKHDINAVIAFSMGLIVVATSWVVGALTDFLPYVGLLSVVVISALMLLAMFYEKLDDLYKVGIVKYGGPIFVTIGVAMSLMYVFGWNLRNATTILGIDLADLASVAGIIIFLAVIMYIVKPAKQGGKP